MGTQAKFWAMLKLHFGSLNYQSDQPAAMVTVYAQNYCKLQFLHTVFEYAQVTVPTGSMCCLPLIGVQSIDPCITM